MRSMFARLFTVFMAVILACVLILFSIFYFVLRDNGIDARMDALKTQAREMAYLASRLEYDRVEKALGFTSQTEKYLEWKVQTVFDEFGAYSVVVDRRGVATAYVAQPLLQDEALMQTLSRDAIMPYLERVLAGEEIVMQTSTENGPMFTVAVPRTQDGTVLGAIFIQTSAQSVHASYTELGFTVALVTLFALVAGALLVFFFTRQMTLPLTAMAKAADGMSRGEFDNCAPVTGSSETRRLAVAFNEMSAQLAATEQSRRDFVANVSHELRSPVTSIQGYAQGMLDGTIPEEEREKYMRVVVDETRRLSKLIGSLLNLSRLENEETPLSICDFDVNETARRVLIGKLNQIEEKEIEVETAFEQESCFVRADADQIEQVLINLADNAVKFTPRGGKIEIATRVSSGKVFVTVRDNGVGVLPQDAPHIFDRFYKAEKAHTVGKGTGLGLSIVKRILERHGQDIRLLDTKEGAAFEFTRPQGSPVRALPAQEGENRED